MAPRRGSVYLAVLAVVTLVTLIGLTAIAYGRRTHERVQTASDIPRARALARSGIEYGLMRIERNPNWRDDLGGGVWLAESDPGVPGGGTVSVQVGDLLDGDLLDRDNEPFVLVGTGRVGQAKRSLMLTLEPKKPAYNSLGVPACIGGDAGFSLAGLAESNGFTSNGSISASFALVEVDVVAGGLVKGARSQYTGGIVEGAEPLDLPDPGVLLSIYESVATQIEVGSLHERDGKRWIEQTVLGPGNNVYSPGDVNPRGVYIIDCRGETVKLKDCRIRGTLILTNVGPGSGMEWSVNMMPDSPNYPSLLVFGGDFVSDLHSTDLDEANKGMNFNPPGADDEGGVSDEDTDDTYPSEINGVVYIEGNLKVNSRRLQVNGVLLVGGDFEAKGLSQSFLNHTTYALDDPPPGFVEPSGETFYTMSGWEPVLVD